MKQLASEERGSFRRSLPLFMQEGGFAVPFVVLLLLALLAVLGLATDAGFIYRAQLRLQRSVDAGAIGATYLFGSQDTTEIRQTALRIATDNSTQMGLVAPTLSASVTGSTVYVSAF